MLLLAGFCLVAGALGKHFLLETDDQPFPIDYTQKESAEETDGQSQGTGKDYMMNSDSSTTQQGTEGGSNSQILFSGSVVLLEKQSSVHV